jgi:ubiquinone/menaquinone biosynthesis C-methylase UbiE
MTMATAEKPSTYIIKGGEQGRARMAVISRVLAPATEALLDRFQPLAGMRVADAGCGGGDVTFELAERVGASGRVVGFDLDESKLAAAREEATRRGVANVEFAYANVLDEWPIDRADFVHIRFVLCHLAKPERMLAKAMDVLVPGGRIVVQDIDYAGQFCDPPSAAVDRYNQLYVAAAQARGGDPFIGRRLTRLLEDVGFSEVDAGLVQPFGRTGDVKHIAPLTLAAIADSIVVSGVATKDELDDATRELEAFTQRTDTMISTPRIFQAWGRKA